ncbi:unnamed protein product [Schistosoma mattheei]|uniref:Uncharacterized protein n=1 Tax=Schistosoma mattheei TaxID=31246 RepID=A0A183PPN0_9TREM|nr:unnamed protein product [Schistosoma mattheei]
MALEAERDTNLREIRRPVISFNEEIRSQRFLNCDGIKTGSLQEFLITIGLPMYINHILHYNSITTNIIPWILLNQTNSTKYSTMNYTTNNIYSLPRTSITNHCCRRSSSQLRKLQQSPSQPPPPPPPPPTSQQQQQQQKRSTTSTQSFINHCQHHQLQDYHEGHEQFDDNFINLEHLVDKV